MSPRDRGPRRPHGQDANEQLPWAIVYYKAPDGTVPALEFLDGCPGTIDAQFTAVLDAVAAAPPPRFSGGGKWEAMHGTMAGWYEIRLTGPVHAPGLEEAQAGQHRLRPRRPSR